MVNGGGFFKVGKWYKCRRNYINRMPESDWHYAFDGKPHLVTSTRGEWTMFKDIKCVDEDGWCYGDGERFIKVRPPKNTA